MSTHLCTTRNPMSESRRQHVHGKLVTLADQARAEGEPSILLGAIQNWDCDDLDAFAKEPTS